MLTTTKAMDDHILYMAPRLRRADVNEIEAYSGMTPLDGLSMSKSSSHLCYTVLDDGEPVAMYGGTVEGQGRANVWMLATDGIYRSKLQFLRHSKSHLDEFQMELKSSFIYAFADPRNTLHQIWMAYCGFQFGKIFNVRGNNFITVTRLKCV